MVEDDGDDDGIEQAIEAISRMRLAGMPIRSEPVWKDRLAEIARNLPKDILRDIAYRYSRRLGNDLVDYQSFAERHGLTRAEARIVESIVEGLSVAEHAEAHGISVNTARVHMQRALEKTGAARQTDLVRLVLGH